MNAAAAVTTSAQVHRRQCVDAIITPCRYPVDASRGHDVWPRARRYRLRMTVISGERDGRKARCGAKTDAARSGAAALHEDGDTSAPRRRAAAALGLLAGGRLRGRVDPGRDGTTLIAKRVSCEPGAVEAMARALREAAEWVGCEAVALQVVDPPGVAEALRAALG
jgi:hypothetical protein